MGPCNVRLFVKFPEAFLLLLSFLPNGDIPLPLPARRNLDFVASFTALFILALLAVLLGDLLLLLLLLLLGLRCP